MKTKDFIEKVGALGYEVSYEWVTLYIKRNGFTILDLGNAENWDIDTDYPEFERMGWNDKKELMTIVSEYMLTDPIDRKEEKRYWLRYDVPPLLRKGHAKPSYLTICRIDGTTDTSDSPIEYEGFQKIFSEAEIAQMDITGFKEVEVEE